MAVQLFDVDRHLKRYPALAEGLPLCECNNLQPCRTEKLIGIECRDCKAAVWQKANRADNARFLAVLSR